MAGEGAKPDLIHQDKVLKGIASGVTAFFMLAVMSMFVRLLGPNHHVLEIAFYRNLIPMVLILSYILAAGKKDQLITQKPLALFFRVLFGTIGLFFTFATLKALPLANATVLFFTSTLLVPALSFFLLKEHIGPHRWLAIAVGMCGVLVMAQPGVNMPLAGILLGVTAAFFHALIQVFLRHLKTESSLTVTFYFMLGGTLIPAVFMPWVGSIPTTHDMLLFLGVGVSGGIAQYFLTSAFRLAPASVISPFNYTGLIWASLFDIAIWGLVPGWPVFAGGGVIMISNFYIIHREHLAEKRKRKT